MPEHLISIADARAIVLEKIRPLSTEAVPVEAALDRVLATDIVTASDVPPFPCSAMDGFAVHAGPAGRALKVVGESRAGAPSNHVVKEGEAIRISTGAAVPGGADAVLRQEDVDDFRDHEITLGADTSPGENVRYAGEDMRAGETALTAGTSLGVPELGVAVAAGVGEVTVAHRPRVAIVSTGDELRAAGERLGPGEIHNSNNVTLAALAVRCGAVTPIVARVRDDRAATEEALGRAIEGADVVVISGGVSVGPHDHVKAALEALGVTQRFWRVALQPGKPTWFGTRGDKLVFGLPGNPVSAVVTFTLFVRPALAALQGAEKERGPRATAQLGVDVPRNPNRDQAVRVRLRREDGTALAFPTGPQGSHIITSLLMADALAVVPMGEGALAAGTTVMLETIPR